MTPESANINMKLARAKKFATNRSAVIAGILISTLVLISALAHNGRADSMPARRLPRLRHSRPARRRLQIPWTPRLRRPNSPHWRSRDAHRKRGMTAASLDRRGPTT